MKLYETLNNYGGITCEVKTDEELKDICLAIKYHDHGDEFLYVRTYSGEEYEYGYWLNRRYCLSDYDPDKNSGESDGLFIKRPILYYDPRKSVELSNKIFFECENDWYGIQKHMDFGPQKYNDAKSRLTRLLNQITSVLKSYEGTLYNIHYNEEKIRYFIKLNELGDEYINRVNDIKWDSKINGLDGIAGKCKSDNILCGDGLISVLYRGKDFDIKKCTYSRGDYDDWGCCTYYLNTRQFV